MRTLVSPAALLASSIADVALDGERRITARIWQLEDQVLSLREFLSKTRAAHEASIFDQPVSLVVGRVFERAKQILTTEVM